jgi:hypothetical protein
MRSSVTLRNPGVQYRTDVSADGVSQLDIPALNSLALRSLVSLFDAKEQLFSERVTLRTDGFHREGTSRKCTTIALLGLHRLAESGGTQPFDIESIRDVLFQDRSWVKSAEDLGLLTWFVAQCLPDRLETVLNEFDFERTLTTYADARQGRTAGLAWFLTGIAHARLACPGALRDVTDVAVDVYHALQENQGCRGLFGHATAAEFPRRALYNRFGTFTDQVSAIYALSMFARAFQIDEPLESALACANSVCALQGNLGQWWFLYDKHTGRVVSQYPVLSVHQDGAAPCVLLALEEATGRSFQQAILKGLSWINGANEIGVDLRSQDRSLIWDSIGSEERFAKYWDAARSFVNISRPGPAGNLKIRYEARPDHFGWLLYAFGKFGLPDSRSFAAHA